MGGIIAGFLGGASNAAAEMGKLMFTDQLQKERDEANFLRESALRKDMQQAGFTHAENLQGAGFEHTETMESGRRGHAEKLQEQNIDAREAEGLAKDRSAMSRLERELLQRKETAAADRASREKIAGMKGPGKPQLIKYTDSKGYEQEGILETKPDGGYRVVKPDSGEIMEDNVTREDLKNMAAKLNVAEGRDRDWKPFNELDPTDDRVRAEVLKEKEAKRKSSGVVADHMDAEPPAAEPEKPSSGIPKKSFGGKQLTRAQYINAMVERYGKDKAEKAGRQWDEHQE